MKCASLRISQQVDRMLFVLWHDIQPWSENTFGSADDRGPRGPLDHILKELVEISDPDHTPDEYADVLILAIDAAWRCGYTYLDLFAKSNEQQHQFQSDFGWLGVIEVEVHRCRYEGSLERYTRLFIAVFELAMSVGMAHADLLHFASSKHWINKHRRTFHKPDPGSNTITEHVK